MTAAYVVGGLRSPFGRYGGKLAGVRPDDLIAYLIKQLVERFPQIPLEAYDEVILGAANQSGEDNRNVARMAVLLAGLPVEVPGFTVNRLCASGLEAIIQGARAIAVGEADIVLAGGVESMSRAPFVIPKAEAAFSRNAEIYDTTIGWRFVNPRLAEKYPPYSMGETAENVAERYHITREAQDAYALRSQQRYATAKAAGFFAEEIYPIPLPDGTVMSEDEHPRPETTLEKLSKLKPAFRAGGTVTAGNSSGINDGAAIVLLASEKALKTYNLTPLTRIVGAASAGVDPSYMGIGPVPATQKLLQRLQLSLDEIDIIELNEAFAAQVLACVQLLGIDESRLNLHGGAIAIGHPLGATGARLALTLSRSLHAYKKKYGLATLCVGVGQGVSVLLERV
ncbi:MAG: acetyl-CoA C-acyltransferase [Bacteroidia bacterium]|nr:acetyl-CoA C-acyltransferase [Bacteroidia bacterium]MCX7764681.1 acetyl-CoA C-acyltransferase [Bacteroidia bacterium]MDW8057760.1 acetyl-CoA C-acyltransferase [Bacteroidia bacterium]